MRPEEELEALQTEDANLQVELAAAQERKEKSAQHLLTTLEHVLAGHPILPPLDTG